MMKKKPSLTWPVVARVGINFQFPTEIYSLHKIFHSNINRRECVCAFFLVARVQFHSVFALFSGGSLAGNLLYLRLLQITNCSNKYIHKLIQANSIFRSIFIFISSAVWQGSVQTCELFMRHETLDINSFPNWRMPSVMWNWLRFFGSFERFVLVSMDAIVLAKLF